MAALPYMQLYVAEYLADTIHLEADEHGAYLLLIMNYWQTAKPIPKTRLKAITRLSNERWTDVEHVLNEYFNDTGTHWQHDRIEADLALIDKTQKQRAKAGKASAEARKRASQSAEKQEQRNGRSTGVQHDSNTRSTNKEEKRREETREDKNREEQKKKKTDSAARSKSFTPPDWIPIEKWKAYVASRKSKKTHPMNPEAMALVIPAIEKTMAAGYALDEILDAMIANGWRTATVKYMQGNSANQNQPSTQQSDDAALIAKITGQENDAARIIEHES